MEDKQIITVFGATGKIGSALLQLLSDAGIPSIAVTRDLAKAKILPFVEWVQADMADLESLRPTMKPGGSVFLLSGHGPNFFNEQKNVVTVAKENGIGYLLKLSSGAANKDSPYLIPKIHGEIEEFIKTSDLPATFLRPNGFMQNWLGEMAASVRKERKIFEATGDGRRPFVDMRDIADVAFAILISRKQHICHAYHLTGSEALSYDDIASLISAAIKDSVQYVPLSLEEARRRMETRQMPQYVIDTLMAYIEDQRNGKTANVSNDIFEILGRAPRTAASFVGEYVGQFR